MAKQTSRTTCASHCIVVWVSSNCLVLSSLSVSYKNSLSELTVATVLNPKYLQSNMDKLSDRSYYTPRYNKADNNFCCNNMIG